MPTHADVELYNGQLAFPEMFDKCISILNLFPQQEVVNEEKLAAEEDEEDRSNSRSKYDMTDYLDKFKEFRFYLLSRGFCCIGSGSFRAVFARGGIVIKIPQNYDGMVDNRVEARAFSEYKNNPTSQGIILAPCRLLSNGCLMMVSVDIGQMDPDHNENHPMWVKLIDGFQCGFYKNKIVAYDFALDIEEREDWEKEWGTHSPYYHNDY